MREDVEPEERKAKSIIDAASVEKIDAVDIDFAKKRGAVMKEYRDVLPLLNQELRKQEAEKKL